MALIAAIVIYYSIINEQVEQYEHDEPGEQGTPVGMSTYVGQGIIDWYKSNGNIAEKIAAALVEFDYWLDIADNPY